MTTVRLNPANSKVYACCLDKSIKVFGLKSGTMLKEMAGQHESYIQGFDFLCVRVADNKLVKTDDLVLSYSFDGKVVLWALGPNAKLFPSQQLQSPDHQLPPVSVVLSINSSTLLRQTNFLLNNVDLNPLSP